MSSMELIRKRRLWYKTVMVIGWLNLRIVVGFSEPVEGLFDPLSFHSAIRLQSAIRHSVGNPCWLLRDSPTESVEYSVQNVSFSGDFRRVLDPERIDDTYLTASGSKRLGENNLFYGSFSYRLQNAVGKLWSHNRQPYSGLPFILADSSCGDWELNGLMWNVEISHEFLHDRLYGGVSIFYNVDEEYKDIFPRPKGNHRDIFINTGIGAISAEALRIGLTIKYYDFQESLKTSPYSLDQEKTPIFYKIRGLDMPLIFRGQTSEERLYSIMGGALSVDGIVQNFCLGVLDFEANIGSSTADNVDGGAYPIKQGKWDDEYASYVLTLITQPMHNADIILFSRGLCRFQSATHPDLQREIYHETTRSLSGGIAMNLGVPADWQMSPSIEITSKMLKRLDTFNGILDYFPGTLWQGYLLLDTPDRALVDFKTGAGFEYSRVGKKAVYGPSKSGFYYQLVTAVDEQYYETSYTALHLFGQLFFGQKRRYSLGFKYLRMLPCNSEAFGYREQLQIRFAIEDPFD